MVAPNIDTGSSCFEKYIVVFSIEVWDLSLWRIGLKIRRRPAVCNILALPMCMEEQSFWAMWICLDLVVDVKVLKVWNIVLVLDFDTGMLIEWPVSSMLVGAIFSVASGRISHTWGDSSSMQLHLQTFYLLLV